MIYAVYDISTKRVVSWKDPERHTIESLSSGAADLGFAVIEAPARIEGPCEVVDSQVVPLAVDQAAISARQARAQRNHLLAASDWTQVVDAPVNQSAWATYRQALRDVPAQANFPDNITWPEPPA